MAKVLVCGGREFNDEATVQKVLSAIFAHEKPSHVIHGGARGADSYAGFWAEREGIQTVVCKPGWNVHGKFAGLKRNVSMLELLDPRNDFVIAFPGGSGTDHMKRIAIKAGVKVVEAPID